jgi:hypothetical protein
VYKLNTLGFRLQVASVPLGLLLVMMLGLSTALAEQRTIAVSDNSENGSPVTLSGTMVALDDGGGLRPYTLKKNIFSTNLSDQGIILMVTKIEVSGLTKVDAKETRTDDYFFTGDVLGPGDTKTLEDSSEKFGAPGRNTKVEPQDPLATARVIFVQFLDGTVWGDESAAKGALRTRQFTLDKLRVLAGTYKAGSEQFKDELVKPSELLAIVGLQQLYAKGGSKAAIERVGYMLHYAEIHEGSIHHVNAP